MLKISLHYARLQAVDAWRTVKEKFWIETKKCIPGMQSLVFFYFFDINDCAPSHVKMAVTVLMVWINSHAIVCLGFLGPIVRLVSFETPQQVKDVISVKFINDGDQTRISFQDST